MKEPVSCFPAKRGAVRLLEQTAPPESESPVTHTRRRQLLVGPAPTLLESRKRLLRIPPEEREPSGWGVRISAEAARDLDEGGRDGHASRYGESQRAAITARGAIYN